MEHTNNSQREREQWGKGSRHGRLEGEEEAGWSGQVGSVIITAAKAVLMWETKQRCEWKHGGSQQLQTKKKTQNLTQETASKRAASSSGTSRSMF